MARAFTRASSHKLQLGTATAPTFGPATLVVVARKASDPGAFAVPLSFGNTDAGGWFLWTAGSASLNVWNGSADVASSFGWAAADGWCLVGVSKASGTVAPRFHKLVFSTGTWSHADAGASAANKTPDANATFGCQQAAPSYNGFFDGDIAAAGVWGSVLTDQQIEALAYSLAPWFQAQPAGMWLLDQDTTGQKVLNLAGTGFNESAVTGTAVASSSPPFSYGMPVWASDEMDAAAATYASPFVSERRTPRRRALQRR